MAINALKFTKGRPIQPEEGQAPGLTSYLPFFGTRPVVE
jgi:hypothetical protein